MPINIKTSKTKKFIIISAVVLIVVITLIISGKPSSSPNQSSKPSETQAENHITRPPNQVPFFISKIELTSEEVIGYGWGRNGLIFATRNGIFLASTNTRLVTLNIQEIIFQISGYALIKSQDSWFIYNPENLSLTPLNIKSSMVALNSDGHTSAYIVDSTIYLEDLSKTTFTGNAVSLEWSRDGNSLLLIRKDSDNYYADIFNRSLSQISKTTLANNVSYLSLSPNGEYLLYATDGGVVIRKTGTQEETNFYFSENSQYKGDWIDNTKLVLTETTTFSQINRVVNNLWLIDIEGGKTFLTNSNPIPRKLNTDIRYLPDPDQKILPLVENNNGIWFLSLAPGLRASYQDSKVTLYPVSEEEYDFSF